MTRVAENAGISRENLYKITSAIGNPTYTSLDGILKALDLDLEIIPRHASSEKGSNSQTFGSKASEAAAQEHSGKHTTLEGRGTCQIAGALDTIRGSSSGQHTSYPFSDMLWTSQTSPSVYAMTQPATPSVVRFVLKPSKRDSPSQELVNVYGR
jgi:transcriptional regulator with XRE-family HTH domain